MDYILSSTSRKEKDIKCFSDRKHIMYKNLLDYIIKSPIFRIQNQRERNNEINYYIENYGKDNELYRSIEELNKKGEQIKRRKKIKKEKEKENNIIDPINIKSPNKNGNINKIKDTKEYGQFSELRNSMNEKYQNNDNKIKINKTITRNTKLYLGKKYNKTFYNFEIKKYEATKKINNVKYQNQNKISNSNAINFKKNNKSSTNISSNVAFYKKAKININKKSIINDKSLKNINPNNKINNDNKKNFHFNLNNQMMKDIKSNLIYDIQTKDKRISINIFYYDYKTEKKTAFKKYKLLLESKNYSMNLINNFNKKNRIKEIKKKQFLSSIKEEEFSNQNSKILDECVNSFILNNTNEVINNQKFLISQFINKIETMLIHIYKRILFYRMKTINIVNKMNQILFINVKKKIESNKKNNSTQIYNRKLGIKVKKKIKNAESKNGIENIKIRREFWNKRVLGLRVFLILYAINKDE